MRGFVAPTDQRWFDFLAARAPISEVNFWRPSGRLLAALAPGEPLFFKMKAPHHAIGGFGLFTTSEAMPLWLAWETFEEANGVPSAAELRRRVTGLRASTGAAQTETIGCISLTSPVFFRPDQWVEAPRDWSASIVAGKGYDLLSGEGARILEQCLERAAAIGQASASVLGVATPTRERFGQPTLVAPRLGQGAFRVEVMRAYSHTCAVTREHTLPVVQAAHIKPYANGGEHEVSNGLALRSDLHRLFDLGYATVRPDLRFQVSPRLRADYGDDGGYRAFNDVPLHLPYAAADHPAADLLRWHNEVVYLT